MSASELVVASEVSLAFKEQLMRPTGATLQVRVQASDGKLYEVRVRPENETRGKKARVYVHGSFDKACASEALAGFAATVGAPSVFTQRGQFPALDKAWDAFNGWIVEQKRQALYLVMEELVDDAEELLEGATFSRKAGCSCGCSPGFVVDGLPLNRDVWVEEVQPKAAPAAPAPKMSVKALGAFVLGLLEQQRAGQLSEHAFTAAVRAAKNGEPLAERFAAIAAAAIESAEGGAS
jgi:hypothetical protein